MVPIVANEPIGIIVPVPKEEAIDPSTGQCVSIIKYGSYEKELETGVPKRTIKVEGQTPEN